MPWFFMNDVLVARP